MGLNFGEVLQQLKNGGKLTRNGWNGKGMWIELQHPDEYSKMTRPYIYMNTPSNSTNHYDKDANKENRIPWLPSNTDLFAEDWEVVE